jgi:hypothetical protein
MNKTPLYVLPKWLHEMISKGYTGGRNEIFYRGIWNSSHIYIYDFTSLFPAMGCLDLPYGMPAYHNYLKNIPINHDFVRKRFGFYLVDILYTPRNIKPLHGVNIKGKLVFGYFDNVMLFSEELLKGI